jgi:type IV pilus assembly protein PilM
MLRLLNRNEQPIGLDIGSKVLKFVQLRPCRKYGYELINLGFEELSPGCIVDGAIVSKFPVSDAIRRIFSEKHIQNRRVNISIAGHSAIVKRISLPLQSEKNLSEAIRWEAEQHIPFDIADVNLDYQVLRRNIETETLDILLVAGKKDKINEYTSIIKMAGKIPELVDVDAFALQNAYVFNYRPAGKNIVALLDIGASIMTINIVSGADFLFTRDVGIGGHHYTEFIQKEFNLSHSQAEALKHGEAVEHINSAEARRVIDLTAEIICLEIQKTYDFLKSTTTADHVDRMIVSGGSIHTPGLIEALVRKFGIPVEKFDSFKKITFDSKQFPSNMIEDHAPDLAVATGLALRRSTSLFSLGFIASRRSKQSNEDL